MALGGLLNGGSLGSLTGGSGGGVLANETGKSRQASQNNSFHRDTRASYWTWPENQLAAGAEQVLARKTIPAGVELSWGYGTANNPENQGYVYTDIQNSTPAAIDGTIYFTQETATGRFERYVKELDTTRLQGSTTERTQMVPFPEAVDFPTVKKDMDMVVRFNPTTTDTPSEADSTIIWPITEYDLTEMQMGGV